VQASNEEIQQFLDDVDAIAIDGEMQRREAFCVFSDLFSVKDDGGFWIQHTPRVSSPL